MHLNDRNWSWCCGPDVRWEARSEPLRWDGNLRRSFGQISIWCIMLLHFISSMYTGGNKWGKRLECLIGNWQWPKGWKKTSEQRVLHLSSSVLFVKGVNPLNLQQWQQYFAYNIRIMKHPEVLVSSDLIQYNVQRADTEEQDNRTGVFLA